MTGRAYASPVDSPLQEQYLALLRQDFYRTLRHHRPAPVAERCQAHHSAHAGGGGALADLDDRLAGRLRNLIITLICFYRVRVRGVALPPWLFALGLTLSTSGIYSAGWAGQRYATIAFGALLIAIYTMLGCLYTTNGISSLYCCCWQAIWYNLLTLTAICYFPDPSLQDNLAQKLRTVGPLS